tara:strand:+ start:474 stop:839 length:366 start_codon:yes stop_codon:yes gene_type:complete
MTKVHHTVYKPRYEAFILDHIERDNEEKKLTTRAEKIAHIFNRFYRERGHEIARLGKHKALIEWLQGIPFGLPCYNNQIIDLAIEMGSIDENPSDKLVSRVLEGYYPFMANILLNMERLNK